MPMSVPSSKQVAAEAIRAIDAIRLTLNGDTLPQPKPA